MRRPLALLAVISIAALPRGDGLLNVIEWPLNLDEAYVVK
jgi:hypothetical protein